MKYSENIMAVDALKITMMGFIFYEPSPRFVTGDLPVTKVLRVGVFVNESLNKILQAAQKYGLTHIQLHGNEPASQCKQLQEKGYKVIKAIPLSTVEDINKVENYDGSVDFLLFDTKCNSYGGSGQKFDWSLLQHYHGEIPFILSGGITPESAQDIIAIKHRCFAGIDLNSGFEDAPAHKNIEKLQQFITQIL